MHKKIIISFFFLVLFSFVSAENCRYQNELSADCNIMVKPLDSNSNLCTASCGCNLTLYNPSYVKIIDNNSMTWDATLNSFWLDTNALFNITGEWIADVNCSALDINRNSIGQMMIVDRDTNKLLHDINASGNGLTASDVWGYATRTLTDYNQSTLWKWLRPLYNQWYLTFAPRYCAIDDVDCIKGISEDSNQRVYSEFTETPTILTFLAENWNWGIVIVIIILFIAVILLRRS